jgi:hypothetical protein
MTTTCAVVWTDNGQRVVDPRVSAASAEEALREGVRLAAECGEYEAGQHVGYVVAPDGEYLDRVIVPADEEVADPEEEAEEGGDLLAYDTAEYIRAATHAECVASREAADIDGGAGVIEVDGQRCYVQPD